FLGEDYEDLQKSLEQAGRDCRFWFSCCSNTSYCQQRPRAAGGPHKITEVGEFVWGLQMKFVISETCAPEARDVFMDEHSNGFLQVI
ncbi:hypothetical protein EE612_025599, partial [Oryza sativa]